MWLRWFSLFLLLFFGVSCSEIPGISSSSGGGSGTSKPSRDDKNLEVISLFVGGEKVQFLENPKTRELLATKHGIRVDAIKAGSLEMVRGPGYAGERCLMALE